MTSNSSVLLPTGQAMPILGFGTWNASGKELEVALDAALTAGYRHIDTATAYENECAIGNTLKKWFDSGKLKRSDLFIVTKLPPNGNRAKDVEKWIKKSLANLQISYLDLYLVHVPFAFENGEDLRPHNENGEIRIDIDTDHLQIWSAMEEQVLEKRTKAIGLSNFNIHQIKKILDNAKLPISNLQIELHVNFQQKELIKFCQDNNISITAYSPLGTRGFLKEIGKANTIPNLLENPTVLEIAEKYKKTPAQILLKHIIQKGIIAIPKSSTSTRIKENIQLFDWELRVEDIDKLNAIDMGESGRICDFSFFKGVEKHPEFPF
ncbi:aldo-keto reductase family 1 member A1-like isoform X2 [Formica exsecta]|uniref:aldo-keto reductase family 1 member A1-like isoform X1 n=1 Tax=Formica exsecta TaxID=72781 RepID=UPI001142B547|nr:aldo-keto reductase family 1 member A1-like isoform X1 [Formica exsecta]XP_029679359.1 aldo-keto reductase family 1 member A1-like isoform X2 [Formica exsecta]